MNHGQTYSISGSGFGSLSSNAPALWDTVDNQTLYNGLSDGADIPVDPNGFWIRSDSPYSDPVNYSTQNLRTSRSTAQYHVDLKGSLGSKDLGDNSVSKFYATWWIKPSNSIYRGPEGRLASTKIIRVWESGNGDDGRLSWTGNQLTAGFGSVNSWGDWQGVSGQWNRVEIYIDSVAGTIQANTNGNSIHDVDYLQLNGRSLNRIWVLGLDPSIPENLDPNLTIDFDDIYVDTTPARVEVCTGSSWENRGACEVQIRSNWSDSQISFKANQGALPNNQNLYLYVVNTDSTVSPPHSIKF